MNKQLKGILWATLSALLWAIGFPATHILISKNMIDPISMATVQFLAGGLTMLGIGYALKVKNLFRLPKSELWKLAVLGFIGTTAMEVNLFYAQKTVSSVNSSMLEAEAPLIMGVLSVLFLRRVSWVQTLGLLVGFTGCLMTINVITADGICLDALQTGDFLIFIAASCWSVYTVCGTSVINKIGAYAYTAWTMVFGSAFMVVLFTLNRNAAVIPDFSNVFAWGLIAFYVFFATVFAFFSWNSAQKYISVALLSLAEYFTPFFTGIVAFLWLKESMTPMQICGAFVIGGAVLIEPEVAELLHRRKLEKQHTAAKEAS